MTNTTLTPQHSAFEYNFDYSNNHQVGTPEYDIIETLSKKLIYQTALVTRALETDLISYNDEHNTWKDCELCAYCLKEETEETEETECENRQPEEIYYWLAFADDSEWTRRRLDKAGIPYIDSDLGFWIGRTDCGSSQELYFLPSLAHALYNYKIDEAGNIINKITL